MTARPRRRLRLVPVLAVLALAVVLAEAAVRAAGIMPIFGVHGYVVVLDADLLFRIAPGSGNGINAAGYPDAEFGPKSKGRHRVLVTGDSFVTGYDVSTHETLPRTLQRKLGPSYEVLNLGVVGDGPDQSLKRLQRDGLRLEPDTVLLGLFAANDFNDVYKNGLYTLDDRGAVVDSRSNPVTEALPPLRSVMLLRKALTGHYLGAETEERLLDRLFGDAYDLIADPSAPESARKISLLRGVLRRYRDELASREIDFAVFILPSYENIQNDHTFRERGIAREDYFRNEELVASICDDERIPYVSLADRFLAVADGPLFEAEGHHLSALGNEYAASFLAELVLPHARADLRRGARAP